MRRLLAVIVTTCLLLAGCGGEGSGGDSDGVGGASGDSLDRCSLITTTEMEQWLAAPVSAAPAEGFDGNPDPVTCSYLSGDQSQRILLQVYDGLQYFAEPGSDVRAGGVDVEGLGEDAYSVEDAYRWKQDNWSASVARIIGLIPQEALLEMAKIASNRLP